MNELKNNSITVKANIMTATEKTVSKAQVMELKVRIPADELAGKRDLLAGALKGTAQLVLTPEQTELDLDKPHVKEADGQTEMIDKDGKVKNPVAKMEKPNTSTKKSMAKSEKPKITGETKAAKAATKKEAPVMAGTKKSAGVVDIASAAQKKAEAAK